MTEPHLLDNGDMKSLVGSILMFVKKFSTPIRYIDLDKRVILAGTSVEKRRLSKVDWDQAWILLREDKNISIVRGIAGTTKAVYQYVPEASVVMSKQALTALAPELILRLCVAVHSLSVAVNARGVKKEDVWQEVFKEPFNLNGEVTKFYAMDKKARMALNKVVISKAKGHPEWPIAVEKDCYVVMSPKEKGSVLVVPAQTAPEEQKVSELFKVPKEAIVKGELPKIFLEVPLEKAFGVPIYLHLGDNEVGITYDEKRQQFVFDFGSGLVSGIIGGGGSMDGLPLNLLEIRLPISKE